VERNFILPGFLILSGSFAKVLKELNQWFTITTVFSFIYTVPAIAFFLFSLLSSASKNILNKLK